MAYNKLFTLTGHSQHRNLKTVDRAINCHNADDTIDCDTGGNQLFRTAKIKNSLPQRLEGNLLKTDRDNRPIAVLQHSATTIQTSLDGLRQISRIDFSTCQGQIESLKGCYGCATGAVARYTCRTDFGSTTAVIVCPSTQFSITCNYDDDVREAHVLLANPFVSEACELRCPSHTSKIQLQAQLQYVPQGKPWTMAAETVHSQTGALHDFAASMVDLMNNSYLIPFIIVSIFVAIFLLRRLLRKYLCC